ncbi:hypothetical protein ACU686_02065 [Yinghuangia aomiensis]
MTRYARPTASPPSQGSYNPSPPVQTCDSNAKYSRPGSTTGTVRPGGAASRHPGYTRAPPAGRPPRRYAGEPRRMHVRRIRRVPDPTRHPRRRTDPARTGRRDACVTWTWALDPCTEKESRAGPATNPGFLAAQSE